MNLSEVIMQLSDSMGVSGCEDETAEVAVNMLKNYTDDCIIKNGNVIANFGKREEGKKHILLDAHLDQVGFVVTYINDNGFLKVAECGGIDKRILLAQQVKVFGKKIVDGYVCTLPPHLSKEDKVPDIDDIYIDIGMTKENAEKIVSAGDKVVFSVKSEKLLNGRITGAGLDDRCGMASLVYVAELLKDKKPDCSYTIMFSTQEEVGGRGATIGGYEVNPDIAIEVDTSFALTEDEIKQKCGYMGKGPMIGIASVLDRELSHKLMELAKEKNIPYQNEIMSGRTGTNADKLSVTRNGVKASTVSIPIKYMHTPVEIVSVADVENTAKLIAAYVEEVK